MIIQQTIEDKLQTIFTPSHLEVINESFMHNVPPGSESHFKVVMVSKIFEGQMLLNRHKKVNECLADELKNKIHALSLQLLTPAEWVLKNGQSTASPPCLGGSKTSH